MKRYLYRLNFGNYNIDIVILPHLVTVLRPENKSCDSYYWRQEDGISKSKNQCKGSKHSNRTIKASNVTGSTNTVINSCIAMLLYHIEH